MQPCYILEPCSLYHFHSRSVLDYLVAPSNYVPLLEVKHVSDFLGTSTRTAVLKLNVAKNEKSIGCRSPLLAAM